MAEDYAQPPERPFSERTPSGVLNYMLRALEARGAIVPRETERLRVLERWGARSTTSKGLHFSVLNDWDGCHIATVDTSLPEDEQVPVEIYEGKFPKTQQEADDLVTKIAAACA